MSDKIWTVLMNGMEHTPTVVRGRSYGGWKIKRALSGVLVLLLGVVCVPFVCLDWIRCIAGDR